jgi:ppGpp synthetase/RelA/SpoT-type nucleotidyltranferase
MPKRATKTRRKVQPTRAEYDAAHPTREALRQEIAFILSETVSANFIKIHAIESRVKEYDSLCKKLEDQSSGSRPDINDVVGARVVCLFKSDLARIGSLIDEHFDVIEKDDK